MKPAAEGMSATLEIATDEAHTASAVGNPGVHVVATTALILFLEEAAHRAIAGLYEEGEGSLGTRVEVDHVGACLAGTQVAATARVLAVEGRKVTFAVEARAGDKLLMTGRHQRVVVELARFLKRHGLV